MTDMRPIARRREFHTYLGSWRGESVLVSSHGVGSPGAQCLFEELAEGGVSTIVRLGTTGALQPGIEDGDLVIADACIRDDGVTVQLIPPSYPAAASPEIVLALQEAAVARGAAFHRGIVWTRAAFYPDLVDLGLERYVEAGVLSIEMELSALLVFAARRRLRAGGVLVVDGAAADGLRDGDGYNPHREVVADGVRAGVGVALDALVAVSR
nr:nucleoside phosphorylase [Epidermidibacterium keratini]